MTLLELLVKELPKRGGWPIDSDDERTLTATLPDICWGIDSGGYYAFRGPCDSVSHKLYEETLLALKSEWDGEGLPAVGCECEVKVGGDNYNLCRIVYSDSNAGVAFIYLGGDDEKYCGTIDCVTAGAAYGYFRPIRSEADKKREEAISEIASILEYRKGCSEIPLSGWIYTAIDAGKIPGVKLED